MKNSVSLSLFSIMLIVASACQSQPDSDGAYTFKPGDPNGIGKWYMGREIAHVMGYHGIDWLERADREEEENTSKLFKNMAIQADDVVADIGAGSGYHVFRMAALAPSGKIYGVDIQDEMLEVMQDKKRDALVENVELVKGTTQSVNLPEGSIDKILMVDVYHEFDFPKEMMDSMVLALKPDGKIFLIEYRREDAWVPIKEIHKMTEAQAIEEMAVAGLILEKNIGNLPWQHCMVFTKKQ